MLNTKITSSVRHLATRIHLCTALIAIAILTVPGCSYTQYAPPITALALSVLRSPIALNAETVIGEVDPPLQHQYRKALDDTSNSSAPANTLSDNLGNDRFESFDKLADKRSLLFVTISGGGARAGALASHTMSLLERRYNEIATEYSKQNEASLSPMSLQIDAYSTVSGGSLYAFNAALRYHVPGTTIPPNQRIGGSPDTTHYCSDTSHYGKDALGDEKHSLEEIECSTTFTIRQFGLLMGAQYFIWLPEPFLTFFTTYSSTELLGLELANNYVLEEYWKDFWSTTASLSLIHSWTMKDLTSAACVEPTDQPCARNPQNSCSESGSQQCPEPPLFLFNTTALETGRPLVITQKVLNRSAPSAEKPTARLDLPSRNEGAPAHSSMR